MFEKKVRIVLEEEALGMTAANPEVHREYIASKHPDGVQDDEMKAVLSVDEELHKAMTVFPRDADGNPIFWNYQIKGMFKDCAKSLMVVPDTASSIFTPWTVTKPIDTLIFIQPREVKIIMPEGSEMGVCTRPLRAQTMQGERVSLATSETVPTGSVIEFTVKYLAEKVSTGPKANRKTALIENLLHEWLEYGALRGLGGWRNSGKGIFTATIDGEPVSS